MISRAIVSALSSVMPMLFNDPKFAKSAVYKRHAGTAFNRSEGVNETVFDDTPVTILLLDDSIGGYRPELAQLKGRMLVVFIRTADLPGDYELNDALMDKVFWDNKEFSVIKAEPILDMMIAFELEA